MTKLVLVTGGAGFIGSHLVEALIERGYRVRVIDNLVAGRREWLAKSAEFIEGDITNIELCSKAVKSVAGIFHLAAMSRVTSSIEYVDLCTRSNVVGTQNLLMAASEAGISKFVYSGTSAYYGNQPAPHREYETANESLNFYGLTKVTGEKYCLLFDQYFNVPSIILRYFNVYGPRQPQTGTYALVLGIFLEKWKKGVPLTIHGDGQQRRDFVHVRDVVNANIMAFESGARGKVYNVGSGTNVSVKELADMISDNQVHGDRRIGDAIATLADISRIRSDLGWTPSIDFETGLKELKERIGKGLE